MQGLRFALNHMAAPRLNVDALLAAAAELGFCAVEIRNDLQGRAIADGTDALAIRRDAEKHSVRILSINALQRFNDWTEERAAEAEALANYAKTCGAEALVLCPVNDLRFRPGNPERLEGLRRALSELRTILSPRGIRGLVEPLGFSECSLRSKREAVEAIDATGGGDTFQLVHDTFHHAIAGEPEIFPERTGLVHISGVEEKGLALSAMRDAHRVLVGPHDRLDNAGQIRRLIRGGYDGYFSFEPFAESVHAVADVPSALRQSAAYLAEDLEARQPDRTTLTDRTPCETQEDKPAGKTGVRTGKNEGRNAMKRLLLALAASAVVATGASAETIGVSMSELDNFLTVLRNGIADYAKEKGVEVQIEVAEKDPARQLSQIQNFIASGVDAIIVNPVDTDATSAQSQLAADAGIPLVYVNREPVNLADLPDNQTFVGSDERDSGTLESKEVCRLLIEKGKGDGANIVVMMGQLNNQAARQRTQDIKDVIATPECSFMSIVEEQTANWYRTEATDLMNNWLSAGVQFDAFISNNDEMAIGGIAAMKAAGMSMEDVIVGGVDATQDALAAMQAGDLDVTVFQNAAAQGGGAVDAALRLAAGEKLGNVVWVPFELVTPANIENYLSKN